MPNFDINQSSFICFNNLCKHLKAVKYIIYSNNACFSKALMLYSFRNIQNGGAYDSNFNKLQLIQNF